MTAAPEGLRAAVPATVVGGHVPETAPATRTEEAFGKPATEHAKHGDDGDDGDDTDKEDVRDGLIVPTLRSARVCLRPATRADAAEFYHLLLELGLNTLPTLDQWVEGGLPFRGSVGQFAVLRATNQELVGFTALHELDPNAGHLRAGVYARFEAAPRLGAEASVLTLNYAFAMYNIRKVYFHTTEASLPYFGGTLAQMARREAVLPGHQYFRGKLWDVHILAIYREDWIRRGVPLAERLVRSSDRIGKPGGNIE